MKLKQVNFIAVHCSATPPDRDIGAREIDKMHRKEGFMSIGYHFVIRRDGTVEKGRPEDQIGSHVRGYNDCSLGVCLVGGVDGKLKPCSNYTEEQWNALKDLLFVLTAKYPKAVVKGHYQFPGVRKACPCFPAREWWLAILEEEDSETEMG